MLSHPNHPNSPIFFLLALVVQPLVLNLLLSFNLGNSPPQQFLYRQHRSSWHWSRLTRLRNRLASTGFSNLKSGERQNRIGMIEVKKNTYAGQNLDFSQYAIAITSLTDKQSKIWRLASNFPMYDWMGGRTSAPWDSCQLPYGNRHSRAMLDGAERMNNRHTNAPAKDNPAGY